MRLTDIQLTKETSHLNFAAKLIGRPEASEEVYYELTAAECYHLAQQLNSYADEWMTQLRRDKDHVLLENDESLRRVVEWLAEHNWGDEPPATKVWLHNRVMAFKFDERGPDYDERIKIPETSPLGILLSQLPMEHHVLDYLEIIDG